jgi:hypothetical protein
MKFDSVVAQPAVDLLGIDVFRVENFPSSDVVPWLDRSDWREQIAERLSRGELTLAEAERCRQWAEHGYVIVPEMFAARDLDRIWQAYEIAIARGDVSAPPDYGVPRDDGAPGRTLNPHFKIDAIREMLCSEASLSLVSLLLGAKALPFQTIAGHVGSEQKTHSDSIHMTTYPQGYLIANWIAFEDIAADAGPLEFYPGSHRLPYLYAKDCGIDLEPARRGYDEYQQKYEPAIARVIKELALEPAYFHARKGDVLFWHANLLHGGSKIANPRSSRRALVCHYFAEGCVCYHDYTGTASHITELPKRPILSRSEFDAAAYLARNPDVAAAGVDAYQHYANHGYDEGRLTR